MVRRRCRLIVVVDAGCDPDFTFADLGNAVRKIYIDLGVRITFDDTANICAIVRPKADASHGSQDIPYCAIGTIHYRGAERRGCENGTSSTSNRPITAPKAPPSAATRRRIQTFPHETTVDQWFTESQFESYRALGLDIGEAVSSHQHVRNELREFRGSLIANS